MKFDSYHPMINFIFFAAAITFTICFKHPIFVGVTYISAFAYSIKLGGARMILLNVLFFLLALGYALNYASYEHFGVTVLAQNMIDNQITLESLVFGLTNGLIFASVCMWFSCVFMLITSDKIVYLFGRVSPKLSLFLSILLRTIPRVRVRAKRIEISRKGIGRGVTQGNVGEKLMHFFSLLSILITWTLEDFVESSNSMKSRGYSLKGRTAFSIYRFDNRDRSLVIVFFWCLTVIGMGILLNQTTIYFDPVIILNPITKISYVFYIVYAMFLLLPMILQIIGEKRFDLMRKSS